MIRALIDSTPVESCAGAPVLTCARKVCIYYKTATAIYFRECVGLKVAKPEGLRRAEVIGEGQRAPSLSTRGLRERCKPPQ